MAPLKPTSFRLTEEDIAILDAAQEHFGLLSRVDALRFLIRQWPESVEVLKGFRKRNRSTK